MQSKEFNREYGPVYQYAPPPIMPGIRKLCGVPEEHQVVNSFYPPKANFSPHLHSGYNNPKCGKFMIDDGIEQFGGQHHIGAFIFRLVIFIAIIYLIICLLQQKQQKHQ